MTEGMIYAGEAFIQQQYRINVVSCCRANGINIGDRVRVWIEHIDEDDCNHDTNL